LKDLRSEMLSVINR